LSARKYCNYFLACFAKEQVLCNYTVHLSLLFITHNFGTCWLNSAKLESPRDNEILTNLWLDRRARLKIVLLLKKVKQSPAVLHFSSCQLANQRTPEYWETWPESSQLQLVLCLVHRVGLEEKWSYATAEPLQ